MNRALAVSLIIVLVGCAGKQVGEAEFPPGEVQHAVHGRDVSWTPCASTLPSGCEIAVMEGDPRGPDLFTVRFRLSDSFIMPPHTHPKDERVTVLSGRMAVAFGTDASRETAARFGPGDYYVNARDAVHSVWVDRSAVIQITGIGPWEAHFIDWRFEGGEPHPSMD